MGRQKILARKVVQSFYRHPHEQLRANKWSLATLNCLNFLGGRCLRECRFDLVFVQNDQKAEGRRRNDAGRFFLLFFVVCV